MPIIARVGRQTVSVRIMIVAVYVALILGAVTMLYPFLLMVSHSISSDVDMDDYQVIPSYFYDDNRLFQKYIADKYNSRFISYFNNQYGTAYGVYEEINRPAQVNEPFVDEWFVFKTTELPLKYQTPAFRGNDVRSLVGEVHKHLQRYALAKYGTLEKINAAYQKELNFLRSLAIYTEAPLDRDFYPLRDSLYLDWLALKPTLPQKFLYAMSGEGKWAKFLEAKYKGMLETLNQEWGTNYQEFKDVPLSEVIPSHRQEKLLWADFVMNYWPFRYCRYTPEALPRFRDFLKEKYGTIGSYNHYYGTHLASFARAQIPEDFDDKAHLVDWNDFVTTSLPLECIQIITTEKLFREYLVGKYRSLDGINRQFHTTWGTLQEIKPPYLEADWTEMVRHKGQVRTHFITRNYAEVIDYIFLHGRALLVTAVYIGVIIFTQLTVNPFCAYALSRFNLSYAYKVILFLLVTMAFPAEVTMIPNFILMKQLHMLNTFWALFLPGMANGFFIFILKGYFDSLPPELYEAANLDGASELMIYWKITLPMARPVMAWMTLNAFMAAYGAFMFAMIICQDSRMWTLMVWIYEMQNWAPPYLITAAITISAVPSLVVFTLCQNVIMRGMVLPVST